ncbi:hypothetical protein E2C01_056402 [Portunus trituberculatus]|uniref:Uncharacterized protein n=1 Tax=Portunus trituberculatus TaxID=210409 RepID=A0A5B7GZI3_PORTR|nr:hypothetical protein [Portunus trituberculatus]
MADSEVRGSEMLEGSEGNWKSLENLVAGWMQEMSEILRQELRAARVQFDLRREETHGGKTVHLGKQQEAAAEVKEELVAVRQQCEGRTGVAESEVDTHPCPGVGDTGAAKTIVGEEVVALQDLPVSDRQLCGVTGHCTTPRGLVISMITVGGVEENIPAFVANMEEPCLVGLDSLQRVWTPEGWKCREGEVADATVRARKRQAAVSSCGGEVADATGTACGYQAATSSDSREVDGEAGEASPTLSPHVVDLEVCSSTKLTPEQVVKVEKWLIEHEDVFSRYTQDLGCTSLVQPSNMVDSPPMKQPHSSVPLAKREEMRLPLDLATS